MDEKYELLKHPNVKYTTDGGAPAYTHGGTENAVAGLTISRLLPPATLQISRSRM